MGNIKCEKYWPDVSESLTFDHMEIKTMDETEMIENEIMQRTLKIESKYNISFFDSFEMSDICQSFDLLYSLTLKI